MWQLLFSGYVAPGRVYRHPGAAKYKHSHAFKAATIQLSYLSIRGAILMHCSGTLCSRNLFTQQPAPLPANGLGVCEAAFYSCWSRDQPAAKYSLLFTLTRLKINLCLVRISRSQTLYCVSMVWLSYVFSLYIIKHSLFLARASLARVKPEGVQVCLITAPSMQGPGCSSCLLGALLCLGVGIEEFLKFFPVYVLVLSYGGSTGSAITVKW